MRLQITRTLQFAVTLFLISITTCFCQTNAKSKKVKIYNAIVTLSNQKKKMAGILKEVTDSAIYILVRDERIRIPAKSIQKIVIKSKGNVGRSAFAGVLGGVIVGFIVGYSGGDDTCDGSYFCIYETTAEEKGLGGAIVGGGLGAFLGILIAKVSAKERLTIAGDQNIFQKNVVLLKKYSVVEIEL